MPNSTEFISEIVCSYNFHIFRFSRSGKGEVDVYRMCMYFLSRSLVTPRRRCVIVDALRQEQILSYTPQLIFDTTLRNKGYNTRLGAHI